MKSSLFRSTRSDRAVSIETAIVEGLSPDGGLYVPVAMPALPDRVFDPEPLAYAELARLVLEPFFPGWEDGTLSGILERAYSPSAEPRFFTPEVAPLRRLDDATFLIELFHGRTCAFKDLALSVMGGLLRESLNRLGIGVPVLVLAATSGDTGSAALEGFSGVPGVSTAVLYPDSGTSEIQRLQMTCVPPDGRFVAGLRGDFDDAQRAVKAIFAANAAGEGELAGVRLSSANSINIGRLLPQVVYYVKAWRDMAARGALDGSGMKGRAGGRAGRLDGVMNVAVPTGNFGDILAARWAKSMGLPVGRLVCASNSNRVLADFFAGGVYDRRRTLVRTDSPSMDILVSSNLERLLFEAGGTDPARVRALMADLASAGAFGLDDRERAVMADFAAGWADDATASAELGRTWKEKGVLVDPHTAVALAVLRELRGKGTVSGPFAVAATASPFKFPRACAAAVGLDGAGSASDLDLAERLADLAGIPVPAPIAALRNARQVHDRVLEKAGVASALAEFAHSRTAGGAQAKSPAKASAGGSVPGAANAGKAGGAS